MTGSLKFIHMHTGDLLAIRFFLLPADRCSSDRALKYLNFVLNVRRLVNNTQRGLSNFLKTRYLFYFGLYTLVRLRSNVKFFMTELDRNQFLSDNCLNPTLLMNECLVLPCIVIMSNHIFISRSEHIGEHMSSIFA